MMPDPSLWSSEVLCDLKDTGGRVDHPHYWWHSPSICLCESVGVSHPIFKMLNSHLTIDRCCVFTKQQLCTWLDETHEPLVFGNLILPSLCLVCSSLKLPGHLLSGINRKWKFRSSEGAHSALLMKIRLWGCGCGVAVLQSLELTGVKARQSLTFDGPRLILIVCLSLIYTVTLTE